MIEVFEALSTISNNAVSNIHTTFPAKVISYNESANKCSIQPIFNQKLTDGEEISYPQIQNVPVIKWRIKSHTHDYEGETEVSGGTTHRHEYKFETNLNSTYNKEFPQEIKLILKSGDIVLCTCSEKSIDSIFSGQVHTPQSQRKHDITDAIVIGIL